MADLSSTLPARLEGLRVAIVHYWFVGRAGGERVVEELALLFPSADLFALVAKPETMTAELRTHRLSTSFLQRVPGARRYHRHTFLLQPLALEQFDLSSYDLVISSESGPAKGVITGPNTLHVCYCHSPMRYIWDLHAQYTAEMRWPVKPIFRMVAHWMRLWDFASASRVDEFIANSQFVASRIRKLYRRESTVIHPPVEVQGKTAATGPGEFYLSAGRLVDYKRVDLAVSACRRLGRKLKVVGEGPQLGKLKRIAGEETEFLGRVSDTELPELLSRCRALLFPGEEDFGIVPVEAQAHGRPVIAFASGGALETVIGLRPTELFRADSTGIFFTEQTVDAVVDAIHRFEGFETRFDPQRIHEHALQFDTAIFRARMIAFLLEAVESFDGGRRAVVEADFHSVPL